MFGFIKGVRVNDILGFALDRRMEGRLQKKIGKFGNIKATRKGDINPNNGVIRDAFSEGRQDILENYLDCGSREGM